jgi:hypothetical protein
VVGKEVNRLCPASLRALALETLALVAEKCFPAKATTLK